MTTAYDIIHGALRKIGVIAVGESLAADDAKTGMEQLNALLDTWSNEHLAIYNNVESVLQLQAGKAVYSVGAGGDFNIARPLRISAAYSRLTPTGASVDYACAEIDFQRYSQIGLKSQPGPWPKVMYYDTGFPLANMYFWPVPSQNAEFHLWYDAVFPAFVNLTDTVQMPQGYMLALQAALACILAPEYGVKPDSNLFEQARSLKKTLKSTNMQPVAASQFDGALLNSGNGAGWVYSGGF